MTNAVLFDFENGFPDYSEEPSEEPFEHTNIFQTCSPTLNVLATNLKPNSSSSQPNFAYLALLAPVAIIGAYVARRLYKR